MKKHIPNIITLCNLTCGCIGILFSFEGNYYNAFYCIILATIFDFLDGFFARLLHVKSAIGKELDSLADMVTFGVLPSFLMYHWLKEFGHPYLHYSAFLIASFSALRLAKFNIDTRQTNSFLGLPTPANALFISSLIWLKEDQLIGLYINHIWVHFFIVIIFSLLMVLEIKLIALKFTNYSLRQNMDKYILVLSSIVLLFSLNLKALPLIILIYLVISIVDSYILKRPI